MSSKRKKSIRLTIGVFFVIFIIWTYWGNVSIQTTQIDVQDTQIPDSFEGFVIAHITDLHNAEFGDSQIRLITALKKSEPDIIVVTGDLINSRNTDVNLAMEFISGAVNIATTYYVTGNHEARIDQYDELEERLIDEGVIVLRDEIVEIEKNNQSVYLIGLDDPDFKMPMEKNVSAVAEIDQRLSLLIDETMGYKILLFHRPEFFSTYAEAEVDLVLSGHAHGGQFRLPFIGGLFAPNQGFFPDYTAGLYEKGNTKMVVSRGLGNSIIPVRINNRPEIVVITLK